MFTRRAFLASLSAATAGLMLPRELGAFQGAADGPVTDRLGELLPLRKFGRYDNEPITALGIGGHHIQRLPADQRQPALEKSMELGIRFYDNAVSYGNGGAEDTYGQFLIPKYRDDIFLMTKSTRRTGEEVAAELEDSLRRMKTDHLDLWQIHSIHSPADVENRVNNGVLDTFVAAKEQGKTRYIGFTGHTDYRAHVRMFELLEERDLTMDAVQMPINAIDPHYDSFIEHVLPTAVEKGYAVLAMKTLAFGRFWGWEQGRGPRQELKPLIPEVFSFEEATHFCWSLPISTRITGMESVEQIVENAAACRSFTGMDDASRTQLIDRLAQAAEIEYEHYKRRG